MKDDEKKLFIGICEHCPNHGVTNGGWDERTLVRDYLDTIEIPIKRCWYLLEKWVDKGWYDFGVTLDLGWITPEGQEECRRIKLL